MPVAPVISAVFSIFQLFSIASAEPPETHLAEKHRAFFKAHCLDCHDSETREGKVDLETLPMSITTVEQAELWRSGLERSGLGPDDLEAVRSGVRWRLLTPGVASAAPIDILPTLSAPPTIHRPTARRRKRPSPRSEARSAAR